MRKSFLQPALAGLVIASLFGAAISLPAEDQKPAPPKPEAPAPPRPAREGKPYGGTIGAVDKTAMTVTIKKKDAEKTFAVTSATKIKKGDKPATLDDAVVGEEAGVYFKENAGKAEALSLRLGPKPEKPNGEKKKKTEDAAKPEEKK